MKKSFYLMSTLLCFGLGGVATAATASPSAGLAAIANYTNCTACTPNQATHQINCTLGKSGRTIYFFGDSVESDATLAWSNSYTPAMETIYQDTQTGPYIMFSYNSTDNNPEDYPATATSTPRFIADMDNEPVMFPLNTTVKLDSKNDTCTFSIPS